MTNGGAMRYQVMPELTPIEYAALKADIAERGVLVPVEVDESGELLDGHHRVRAWRELSAEGINLPDYPCIVRAGLTEEQKRNHARSLNVLRRQLTKEQRDEVMKAMRQDGATYQEIAAAVGVSYGKAHEVASNVNISSDIENSRGQLRPATYAKQSTDPRRFAWEFGISSSKNEADGAGKPQAQQRVYPLTASNHAVSFSPDYDGDEWYTPPEYIEAARRVMGAIDLDPASTEAAQEVVRAGTYYTKQDDGLVRTWAGRIWINPPYSLPGIKLFVDKLISEYAAGHVAEAIILTNNSSDTAWFHSLLSRFPACFTRGRVQFWRPDHDAFGARQGQTLFYLGSNVETFAAEFAEFGIVVRAI